MNRLRSKDPVFNFLGDHHKKEKARLKTGLFLYLWFR